MSNTGALVIRLIRRFVLPVAMYFGAGCAWAGGTDAWILIDAEAMTLTVLREDTVKRVYSNISMGRGGITPAKKRRDGKTPLGEFRIARISTDTSFHRFFGLDYPDIRRASRGLQAGDISRAEYLAISAAIKSKRTPPQDTALGGYIGIHGIGEGNPAIHEDFNWTYGCVALTNEQVDDLFKWVRIGMKVVIRH